MSVKIKKNNNNNKEGTITTLTPRVSRAQAKSQNGSNIFESHMS